MVGTISLNLDSSKLESLCREVVSQTEALERFRKLLLRKLHGLRGGADLDQVTVSLGATALDAGDLVVSAEIAVRELELIRSALRTLQLDVAHGILQEAYHRD